MNQAGPSTLSWKILTGGWLAPGDVNVRSAGNGNRWAAGGCEDGETLPADCANLYGTTAAVSRCDAGEKVVCR